MADDEQLIKGANPIEDRDFFKKDRFSYFPEIEIKDLLDVDDPHPIWEGAFRDNEAATFHVFTVGGWLARKGDLPKSLNWLDDKGGEHGHTVGGDLIIIHSVDSKEEAFEMAKDGLLATLDQFVRKLQDDGALENARGAGIVTVSGVRGRRQ